MAAGTKTVNELFISLKANDILWNEQVDIMKLILTMIDECWDNDMIIERLQQLIPLVYNLRSGFVGEIFKFLGKCLEILNDWRVDLDGLMERLILSEEFTKSLCSANKVIYLHAEWFL